MISSLFKKEYLVKYVIFILLIFVISIAIIIFTLNTKSKQTEFQIEFKLAENSIPIQNSDIGANAVISFKGDADASSFYIDIYVNGEKIGHILVPGLAAGQSITINSPIPWTPIYSQEINVTIIVDPSPSLGVV